MEGTLRDWFLKQGLARSTADQLSWVALALAVIIVAILANFVARRFLITGVKVLVMKSRTRWDDALVERKVFTRLSHLAPALVIYFAAELFPSVQDALQRLSMVYMVLAGLYAFNALLNAADDIYRMYGVSRERPIKGYVQVVKIIVSIFVIVYALGILLDRSPWPTLTGLGAMTAILLLVFKDSILGLVASIQLTGNDMVRIGDWVEMPKYGADGDVIDVTLHTVKVQNWDKTITTIPTYAMISDAFKNWRGMSESGGRRIKRSIYIDMTSIKFCTPVMLDRFERFQLISDHIRSKRKEIADYNKEHGVDASQLINGRNLTNIGTLRAYIAAYLANHPKIHQGLTFLIRHLQPGEYGLPVEIYVFSNDQVWANYEDIQADIFDHILAVVPLFDLRVFQRPSGHDLRALALPSDHCEDGPLSSIRREP